MRHLHGQDKLYHAVRPGGAGLHPRWLDARQPEPSDATIRERHSLAPKEAQGPRLYSV